MARTTVSKSPRNIWAVTNDIKPTITIGPYKLVTSPACPVMFFKIKMNEKIFPTVMATFPRKTKTLAMRLANWNFKMCLMFIRKALQAEEQKLSPETAM